MTVRQATASDARRCAEIYAPYVTGTAISFETVAPDEAEMGRRIAKAMERHAWLVLEQDGEVLGYAYGTEHLTRAAYRWASEVSVYLEQGRRRTGAGRALYQALVPILAARGYRRLIAGITLPNEASLGLHQAFGFTDVGVFHKIGWKHGAWHDVARLELDLTPGEDPAEPPAEIR
jgi:L-amino acid N-acyltransferase YncA